MKPETAEYLLRLEKKIESEKFRNSFYAFFAFSYISLIYDMYLSGNDFSYWSPFSKIVAPYSLFHFFVVLFLWKVILKPSAEHAINQRDAIAEVARLERKLEEEKIASLKRKSNDEYLFGKK